MRNSIALGEAQGLREKPVKAPTVRNKLEYELMSYNAIAIKVRTGILWDDGYLSSFKLSLFLYIHDCNSDTEKINIIM